MTDQLISVGRGDGADIQISDPSVSWEHMHMRVMGEQVELVDLNSTNGVFLISIGRKKIARMVVDMDAVIELGNYSTTPRELLAQYRPPAASSNSQVEPFSRYVRGDSGAYRRK